MSSKSLIKKALGSSYSWSFISKGIYIVLGIFITVFVNRALGPALKGQYAYTNNLISVLAIIGGLGIYQLYPFQRRQRGEAVKSEFVSVTFTISIIYLFVTFCYVFFVSQIQSGEELIISLLMCLITIAKIVDTQFMMFASIDDFKRCKKIGIVTNVGRFLIFLSVYILFKRNVIAVLIGDLIYDLIGVVLYSYIMNIKKLYIRISFKAVGKIIKLGIVPMLFQLLLQLNYNIDVLYMKNWSSVPIDNIGLYSVGVQLAAYIWTVPDIFKEVLYSKTAKDDSINDILWCLRISIAVEVVFLIFVYLIGDKILLILYGMDFVPAISVTKIIFFGVLAMTLFKVLTPLYNAKGKFIANLIILASSVTINMIFNIILIPKYGMIGAAIASVFGYCVCGLVYLIRFSRDFSIPFHRLFFFNRQDVVSLIEGHNLNKKRS